MSERMHHDHYEQGPESNEQINHQPNPEIHKSVEATEHKPDIEAPKLDVEASRHHVDKLAQPRHETASRLNETAEDHQPTTHYINAEIMRMSYQRALIRVRKQLSLSDKVLSRVIHQPIIDSISEVGAKTIGRPSGLLGGGFISLVGTTIYYWITKHYGYDYNFSVFLALAAGGFILGVVIELIFNLRLLRKTKT